MNRIKQIVLIVFLITNLFCISSCDQPEPRNMELVWEDEFEGQNIDTSKWTHQLGDGSQYGLWGWGNGELQYYKEENLTLSEGYATITAKIEQVGSNNYTSSRIVTDDKFTFRYGKVEARIKTVDGQGFWPAFWLLPSNGEWPCDGEIDIMEQWSSSNTNVTTGAIHLGNCPYDNEQHQYLSFNELGEESFANNFHVYGIQWEPDYVGWYVDDLLVFEVRPEDFNSSYVWPFNENEWYIILNLAIQNSGPNAQTVFPSEMQIDWVKVYGSK